MVPSPGAPDRVDGARSRAEAQWTRYLERVREGEDLDLREYCEEAPELARSLFDGDADGTFLDRLLEEVSTPSPPSPTELPPSGARYEIRGELARGAMGSILRAFDPNLDRELAMKVILDDEDGSRARALLPRFLQEARVTGQLEHPGIVPVHELGFDGEGRVYFTMPRIEGTDLSTILRRCRDGDGEWPLTRVLGLLSRATDALAFAHSRGVVHRDLKPANIRVGSFGETYVMDWGLAKVLREEDAPEESEVPESAFDLGPLHTRVGSVIGTPHYMPPEQAAGDQESIDARTDVYAMGAILYELLSGRPPYGDDDARAEAVIEEVLRGPPAPIGTGGRRVPAELASIAERAMARDPALRYPSMVEMAADLRAYLEDRVVRAHRTGAVAELRAWVRRNRGTAASLLVLLLVSLGGALLWQADAEGKYRQILRLADIQRLQGAIEAERELDPPFPARAPLFEGFVRERLAPLRERRALHRADLEARRAMALPATGEAIARARAEHPLAARASELRALRAHRLTQSRDEERTPEQRAQFVERARILEERLAALESRIAEARPWEFATIEEQWQHDRLAELVAGLDELFAPGGLASRVEARLAFARDVEEASLFSPSARVAWEKAIEEIAGNPRYGGLRITPQLGLLPLGMDPDSGLWEFLHLLSGEAPERAPAGSSSRLSITEETGIVLVLVPGGEQVIGAEGIPIGLNHEPVPIPGDPTRGCLRITTVFDGSLADRAGLRVGDLLLSINGTATPTDQELQLSKRTLRTGEAAVFRVVRGEGTEPRELQAKVTIGIGTPGVDPWSRAAERPRQEVHLDPFFIGKYEVTQGQWARLTGTEPSLYDRGYPILEQRAVTLRHPVEQVSWNSAADHLARAGLALPTEAQWEVAARGGTGTIWSTGDSLEGLDRFANFSDLAAKRVGASRRIAEGSGLDDGWAIHAPVGSFAPNPYGLHDMHGNVLERCLDWFHEFSDSTARDGDGLREGNSMRYKSLRGGGWNSHPLGTRTMERGSVDPDFTAHNIGLRAARPLEVNP